MSAEWRCCTDDGIGSRGVGGQQRRFIEESANAGKRQAGRVKGMPRDKRNMGNITETRQSMRYARELQVAHLVGAMGASRGGEGRVGYGGRNRPFEDIRRRVTSSILSSTPGSRDSGCLKRQERESWTVWTPRLHVKALASTF